MAYGWEQIGKSRRWVRVRDSRAHKRATAKRERRAAKRDPEQAPTRRQFRGIVA